MHSGSTLYSSSSLTGLFSKFTLKRHAYLGAFLLVLLSSCTASSEEAQNNQSVPQKAGLRLRQAINIYERPNGKQIASLGVSENLQLTGQVSSELYFRRKGKDTLLEPFLEALLPDSTRCWFYADPSSFALGMDEKEWQWSNRLKAILSPDQFRDYQQVLNNWEAPQAGVQMLLMFQVVRVLRNQLEKSLRAYPSLPLHQVTDVLPGHQAYIEDRKTKWWLDYNVWSERAADWPNAAAEQALFQFYQKEVFPPDGIEYTFPAWHFPVSTTQSHSLFGRGQHFRHLQSLDSLQQVHPFVATEWNEIRAFLLEDLTDIQTTYWESWEAVDVELNQILSASWRSISTSTLAEIRLHQERLRQQALVGNQFNYRSR